MLKKIFVMVLGVLVVGVLILPAEGGVSNILTLQGRVLKDGAPPHNIYRMIVYVSGNGRTAKLDSSEFPYDEGYEPPFKLTYDNSSGVFDAYISKAGAIQTLLPAGDLKIDKIEVVVIVEENGSPVTLTLPSNQYFASVPYALRAAVAESVEGGGGAGLWTKRTDNENIYYTAGKVGISTADPKALLHVRGSYPSLMLGRASDDLSSTGEYGFLQIGTYPTGAGAGHTVFDIQTNNDVDEYVRYDFRIKNSTKLYIRGDGNVGIGTAGPANKLSVIGSANITGRVGIGVSAPEARLHVSAIKLATTSADLLRLDTSALIIGGEAPPPTTRFVVKDNARVGIGTAAPRAGLDVVGDAGTDHTDTNPFAALRLRKVFSGGLNDKDSAVNFNVQRYGSFTNNRPRTRLDIVLSGDAGDTYDSSEPNINVMSLRSDGRVGIGTADPDMPLHAYIASGPSNYLKAEIGNDNWTGLQMTNSNGSSYINSNSSEMRFYVGGGGTEDIKMTIKKSGRVGIGMTPRSIAQLDIIAHDGTADKPQIGISTFTSGRGSDYDVAILGHNQWSGATGCLGYRNSGVFGYARDTEHTEIVEFELFPGQIIEQTRDITTPRYAGYFDGHVLVTDLAHGGLLPKAVSADGRGVLVLAGSSDRRKKTDLQNISDALTRVVQLRGYSFKWKEEQSGSRDLGLVAQEVEPLFPEVVFENNDGYKHINYDRFVPIFVEAIKELKAENDTLRAEIEELKQKIK